MVKNEKIIFLLCWCRKLFTFYKFDCKEMKEIYERNVVKNPNIDSWYFIQIVSNGRYDAQALGV